MMCGVDADQDIIEALLERCRQDHAAWINGDMSGYSLPSGATIMGAFGGSLTTHEAAQRGRQAPFRTPFEQGSGEIELVAGGVSGTLAWLVMVERSSVRFMGYDKPRRWELRVTELFRLEAPHWVRFHRHADPLVEFHPIEEVLRILGDVP
jgi:hypothetical protein